MHDREQSNIHEIYDTEDAADESAVDTRENQRFIIPRRSTKSST